MALRAAWGRVDLWVLDKVFQPVCDRLAAFATPFDLARACGTMIIALIVADVGIALTQSAVSAGIGVLGTCTNLPVIFYLGVQLRRIERRCRPGFSNPLRLFSFGRLAMIIGYGGMALAFDTPPRTRDEAIWLLVDLIWVAAYYFAACTPRPPALFKRHPPAAALQGA